MPMTFQIYGDAGLVTPAAIAIAQASDGSTGAVDVQLWLGSTDVTKQLQASADPGVDNLIISATDSAPASGQAVAGMQLALTQAALTAATPGASLDLAENTIVGGVAGAVTFWLRVEATSLVDGTYTDLGLKITAALQTTI